MIFTLNNMYSIKNKSQVKMHRKVKKNWINEIKT